MRRIDPTVGPRAALYAHFRGFQMPWFTLTSPVRVDKARLKAEGGVFAGTLHAVLAAVHEVPELRHRIRVEDGRDVVVEHERVDCTCTVARPDGSFAWCYFPYDPDRTAFCAALPERVAAAAAAPGLDKSKQGRDDMLYASSTPWMRVTGVVHAMQGDPLDCIPRVLWGRIEDGVLDVSVTAHHSLVDGRHVGQFMHALQEQLA